MFCPKCGAEYDDSFSFCPHCESKNPYVEQSQDQAAPVPQAPAPLPHPQRPVEEGRKSVPVWLLAGMGVFIIVVVAVILGEVIYHQSYSSSVNIENPAAQKSADMRTCQSNLRTVDGAILSYEAMFENPTYPTSLGDMTQPGTRVLRTMPTCPSGHKPYILVPDNPPYISCPNDASHKI